MVPVAVRRRLRRSAIAAAVLCGLVGLGTRTGWGYRFYPSSDGDSRAPTSDAALRWSSAVWGPGDTLVWHVVDDPLWQPHFSGAEEALPLVRESLDTWARIASAEVRWRVDGVLSREPAHRDGRNTVSVEASVEARDYFAVARRWSTRRRGGPWEMEECDVVIYPVYVESLTEGHEHGLRVLIHEFGHCLGLAHAATPPRIPWNRRWTASSVWPTNPVMSYSRGIDNALTEDDVIGASLLRPARGWPRTTGSISGRVMLDGQPARFVSVDVLRNDGGRARPSLQVFTGEDGGFVAEGLAPGEYLVWIHPMLQLTAHRGLIGAGAAMNARDLLLARRHAVRAGQETAAGEFTLLPGRDQR